VRRLLAVLILTLGVPFGLQGQQHPDVRRARALYDELDLSQAIVAARRALNSPLTRDDRILAWELLGFSYGALDSTTRAVEAFRELIFLDPDREPDVNVVSPRITSLYASALGQVLVVRRVRLDGTSFIAGQGAATVRYEVSRSARAVTRVTGSDVDLVVDSQLVTGPALVAWRGLDDAGDPVPPGRYQLTVTAFEGRNEFSAPVAIDVAHGEVDTVPHLTSLPGYTEQPESVSPPRNWRPMGIAVLFAGLAAGASIALENPDLSGSPRNELAGASALALGIGLALSLKRPDPQPVEANIRYNQLLREQLTARNDEIARENALRRRQVELTITPAAVP
jgi:hypothetical protein